MFYSNKREIMQIGAKLNVERLLTLVAAFVLWTAAHAIVACPDPAQVQQPDGTFVTLLQHGDEWFNYTTTADGYTVVKDEADGYYKYATVEGDNLVPTAVVAHDALRRNAQEMSWLATTQRHLTPSVQSINARRAKHRLHGKTGHYDYKNFRGLVILVAYNDCPFTYDNAHTLFDDMINQRNYRGFMSNAAFPELIPYTGSVRDYFYDSSAGEFDAQFDVVGPVTINYSQYDAMKTSGAPLLVNAALDAADPQVNYKNYDRDGDGKVDMVFFLFAGAGSNFSGNDSRLLWPHASSITSKYLDGVSFDRYACSTELYSRPESKIIDGIGTICHEFSHVLGIADLYDADGTTGGTCVNPGRWSLMASGSYLNQSRTPCAYSLYERYAAGFITPQRLTRGGTYTVNPITSSNTGYRLDSNVKDEYFLIESRAKAGWDAYLPGEGMLVWRVDSTNASAWENNRVNSTATHPLYELLRAGGAGTSDTSSDPFPGTQGITALGNNTSPSLRSWTGRNSDYDITSITRHSDGAVSFNLKVQTYETHIEDFEDMAITTADASKVGGKYTSWTFKAGARVAATSGEGTGTGKRSCSLLRSSEVLTSALPWDAQSLSLDFYNPTTSNAVVRVYTRASSLGVWATIKTDAGLESTTVPPGENVNLSFTMPFVQGSEVRIVEYSGSRTVACYLDNVSFVVESKRIEGDLNGDGTVDVTDLNVIISAIIDGVDASGVDLNGDGHVDVSDVNALLNIILNN